MLFDSPEEAQKWKTAIDQQAKTNLVEPFYNSPSKSNKKEKEPVNSKIVQSTFKFLIPEIDVFFTAENSELKSELGVDDPYDVGIFSFRDSQINKFSLLLKIS